MYSPKISEDLIPKIYRLGKATNRSMTRVVDDILREYFANREFLDTKQEKEPKITDYELRKGDTNKMDKKA